MRQYIASSMPDKKGQLTVSGKDFKYLCQVLRLVVGDAIWVRFPNDELMNMEVSKVQAKQIILIPNINNENDSQETGVTANQIESKNKVKFILFQFLPKSTKMDLIIRQAVECGISQIVPIVGEFSTFSESSDRKSRWNRIVKEARQQSGSPVPTEILEPIDLKKAIEIWQSEKNCCGFVLHEANISDKNIFSILNEKNTEYSTVGIVVGCEGGISEKEIELLKSSGFNLLHFETNVLRAETAALYGIAIIQNAILEYESWHIIE